MKKSRLPTIQRGALLLGAALLLVAPQAQAAGIFTGTGSLANPRVGHTATQLADGRVLAAGGFNTVGALARTELYDPVTHEWSDTGDLVADRVQHTATLLPSGMVLVAGGFDDSGVPVGSAELYDPATGKWSSTGRLGSARAGHTATLLTNGMVLVTGGTSGNNSIGSAELYDPASGTWSDTDSMADARTDHTATLLPNGMVLVAGGMGLSSPLTSAELYDPASGTWSATGSMAGERQFHAATLLSNGSVLVAGGTDLIGRPNVSAELYDPANGAWSDTGSLALERAYHTATLLPGGMVLAAGGFSGNGDTTSAELYDPASGTWSDTASLNNAREAHTATLLSDGTVLVAGGSLNENPLASAELYTAGPPVIFSPLTATATVGLRFSYQFEASRATSLTVDFLPDGLSFDPTLRAIVGVPTLEGTFTVDLSASNAAGTTRAALVLTIQPFPAAGPIITSVTSATGRTGSPFRFQIISTGGSSAERLTVEDLPDGLTADAVTGEIFGTVAVDGSYLVKLTVTDAGIANSATLQLTFTSDPAIPVIVSPNSAAIFPGIPFSYMIEAPTPGPSDSATYSRVGPLPPGLGLDSDTGIIAGTPNLAVGFQPSPSLAGGIVTNTQIFACNSNGCAAQGLFFLLPTGAANISTRLSVGTGDNVLIGGFITQGNAPMKLIVRGIGPSIPLAGVLANPFLELHSGVSTIASNDDWKVNVSGGSQEEAIANTGLAPMNVLESAILGVLDPGGYTAILSGKSNGTGVGLVEVYNLGAASMDVSSEARLANISTRGFVQTGDNVMIGGFINQGAAPLQVLIRGIGPSLIPFGVTGALANPTLEVHKADGSTVINDDWMSDQAAAIMSTGLAPSNGLESAILLTLPVGDGAYTAIVRGVGGTTGVALVEAYFGDPCLGTSCP